MSRFVALIGTLIIIACVMSYHVYGYVYTKGKDINHVHIPDIIHNNVRPFKIYSKLADVITIFAIIACIIAIMVSKRWDYLKFYVVMTLILFNAYLVITSATTLPDSSKKCVQSKNFVEMLINMGSCNALGISMHLLNVGLSLLVMFMIFKDALILYILTYVLAFFFITASRNHYTLDCIVSTLIILLIVSNMIHLKDIFNL